MTDTSTTARDSSPYDEDLERQHIERVFYARLGEYEGARDALYGATSPDNELVAAYLGATIDVLIVRARIMNMRISRPAIESNKKADAPGYYRTRKLETLYRDAERAIRPPENRPRFYDDAAARAALSTVFETAALDVDRLLMGKPSLNKRALKPIFAYVRETWQL